MNENPNPKDPQLAADAVTAPLDSPDCAIKAAFIAGITAVPAEIDFANNRVTKWDFSQEAKPWLGPMAEDAYNQWRSENG